MESNRSQENASAPSAAELSEREIEILQLVATGVSNKEIAQQLLISANTVKVHLRNIFAKINVASRTEATLYAIRAGLVQMDTLVNSALPIPLETSAPPPIAQDYPPAQRQRSNRWIWAALAVVSVLIAIGALIGRDALVALSSNSSPTPTVLPTALPPKWQASADMLAARSGFGIVTYENQIYAIGGEAGQTVTGLVERYSPADNQWSSLTPKPVAVSDVGAAVVGGRVYVPGGRLASGAITSTVEMYDPREDRWEQRAPLPVALSAYALVAFEGRLYLFGGWDGQSYQTSVNMYDPSRDTWTSHTPMPTARGFAGAAVASGKIYVVGGRDGEHVLAVNEEYSPEAEVNGEPAWQIRAPLPEGRSAVAMTSLADTLYLVGGEGGSSPWPSLEYFPQQDQWQPFDAPFNQAWVKLGLAGVGTNLYAFGGTKNGVATAEHLTYQALYTIVLPVINSGAP